MNLALFRVSTVRSQRTHRFLITGLLLLSVAALGVTLWIMADFLREQEIVRKFMKQLPPTAEHTAEELVGELRWQFRLAILVLLNLFVTGCAVLVLWRAYSTSQQSLHEVKVFAADILNSMDQAVLTVDPEGIITSINRRGHEILSLDEAVVGQPLTWMAQQLPLQEFLDEAKRNSPQRWMRDFQLRGDRRVTVVRAFCEPLCNEHRDQVGTLLQFRDVTDRVLIEKQVKRMERFMGLGSLAMGLHHEIRNPLAALSLHVQLLREHLGDSDCEPESLEMLNVLKTEVNRITGVLESFRTYAAIDQLNVGPVDVAGLVQRQVRLIAPQAQAAKIRLRCLGSDAPIPIQADEAKLEQVILNLLLNAIEAQPDGGDITVSMRTGSDNVSLEVADHGPGIPANLVERIFDPYFTTKNDGTGLGLALSEKVARQHGGTLDVRPSEIGATFQLTLPVASS